MARKQFSNEFKAKVALEGLKGEKTIAQLSSAYGVHASQINTWKQQAREKLPDLSGGNSLLNCFLATSISSFVTWHSI